MNPFMERFNSGAARAAAIPIVGLLGGLASGMAGVWWWAATDIEAIRIVVKAALIGSSLGMGTAIVVAIGARFGLTTVRGLSCLIGVAAALAMIWRAIP